MPSSLIVYAISLGLSSFAAGLLVYGSLAAVTLYGSSVIMRRYISGQLPGENNAITQRQQIPPASTNSIPVVYGDAYLGGTFVDAVLSTDQKTMYYVLSVSSISANGQFSFDTTKMYYGDRLITFGTDADASKVISLTDGAGNVDTKVNGFLWIGLYSGSAAGAITNYNWLSPSTIMGGTDISAAQRWPATGRQMHGQAFAIVKLVYNSDAGTTSLSPITFRCSHYLNGAGVAKPGDVWLDYMTNTVYGAAATTVDAVTAAALNTYSDESISFVTNTGTAANQARYRINGVIDTGVSCLSNVDKILVACDSWMRYDTANGKWSIVINSARAVDYAFTDDNIIGEISVSVTDINNSINQIEAEFPSKLNRDQRDYVNLQTPVGLMFPNEPVNKYSVKYDLVNDSVQVQYLANRTLEQAREDLVVKINTTYDGIQTDAGDVVTLTNAAYGWIAKPFRVVRVNEAALPDGTLGASLELNEYNAAVYDNFDITAFAATPNSNFAAPSFFSPLSAPTVTDQLPNAAVPSFAVSCTIPLTGRVTQITLYYTTASTPEDSDWSVWGTQTQPNSGTFPQSSTFKFSNINLPTNTYYFSFSIANAEGKSNISPKSASYSWLPNPTTSAVAGTFIATFSPPILQVPYTSGAPTFTGLLSSLYGTTAGGSVDFVPAQTDSDPTFVNNSWRIGYNETTGYSDIVLSSGLAMPSPTDGGSYASWGIPSAMSSSPATMSVPVRYKSALGVVSRGAVAVLQFVYQKTGATGATGATGTDGASSRTCYSRIANNPTPASGNITTTGSASFPASTQSNATWGLNVSWTVTDPLPSSTNTLYQADGIFDPSTNITTWNTPYISSLKVGSLSAITVNTGALSVTGDITVGTVGSIKGGQTDYNTGTGFFLGYSGAAYKFSIGSSTLGMTWDGSALAIKGGTITGGSFSTAASGQRGVLSGTGLVVYEADGTTIAQTCNYTGVYSNKGAGSIASAIYGTTAGASYTSGVSGASSSTASGVSGSCTSTGYGGNFSGTNAVKIDGTLKTVAKAANGGIWESNSILPITDNAFVLGYDVNRWSSIWATNGVIQTSDVRTKKDIVDCDLGIAFVNKLRPVSYKFISGGNKVTDQPNIIDEFGNSIPSDPLIESVPGNRTHYGLISQEVKAALGDKDAGFWILSDKNDPNSSQAMRYEELIAPMIKAIQDLSNEIELLKSQINA